MVKGHTKNITSNPILPVRNVTAEVDGVRKNCYML